MSSANNNNKITKLLDAIKKGEKVADVAGKSLAIVASVIELTRRNAGDGGDIASKTNAWREGVDPNLLGTGLEQRREAKRDFFNTMSQQIGKYAYKRQGKLPSSQLPQKLSQAILGAGIDPFLGSVVCGGMVAIDGYLTRRTLREGFDEVGSAVREVRDSVLIDGYLTRQTLAEGFDDLGNAVWAVRRAITDVRSSIHPFEHAIAIIVNSLVEKDSSIRPRRFHGAPHHS